MDLHLILSSAVIVWCFMYTPNYVGTLGQSLLKLKTPIVDVSIPMLNIFSKNTQEFDLAPAKPRPGSCYMWGNSHVKTFDGEVFSFKSTCEHILARDNVDNTFTVSVENAECKDSETCYTVVKIYLQEKEYILSRTYDGIPILTNNGKMLPIPSRLPGIQTQISAHYIVINVDVIGLKIKWDAEHFVEVSVTEDMWNKTAGLCGLFDSDETNDLTSKKGGSFKNVATLVKSWEIDNIGETCTEIPTEKNTCKKSAFNTDPLSLEQLANKFCKNLLTNAQFASCQHALDLQLLQNTCVWDYCECQETNPQHCACQTLDILSRVCVQKGLTSLIKWRDDKTCPYKCSGGKVYMPCGPPGGQPVCGGLSENLVPNPECEEGCYCPEGTAFHKNTCIPIESCPCMNNFKEYTNGESIQKDCNTCTCRKGKWTCTDKTCGARCSIIGDPHYVTFDGARYDFVGTCSYYLLKHNNFTIEAKNSPCLSSLVQNSLSTSSCVRSIVIKIREHVINLKQNHEVTVNGEEIFKLPFNLEGVIIREASSVFIIVELPNDVFVWWNSKSNTAYIDVSPNMVGDTKGLCGVFNQNQRDDFLTPDGDIEHDPIPFANKWKTEETCQDVAHTIQKNPCSVNIHKLPIATENCQIIKGSIFRECQLVVDPDPFFADCMHDMCNCEEDLKDCLCPMVSAYAIQCAAKGVIINWREAIPQCSMNCTKGQQYQICGNSCTRSCSNFEFTSNCIQSCVEGCNCPPGQSLDVDGDCVEIKKCGCYYKTEHYNNDYKQIRDIKGLLSLCTCSDAEWTCRPATPNEIDIYPNDLKDTCNKNEHKEYTPCEPVEYKTCKNMHTFTATSSSPIVCHTGCQCEKDYVLDTETNKCVKPEECPCHHGGQSYKEDSIVHNDCNLCKCVQGKWKCTDKECLGECSAWGDSHYKTFDGRSFDFQGQCDYILARGTLSNKYSFDVSIQNVPCSTLGVSCSKSITIRAGIKPNQETITLTKEEEMPSYALLKHMILKQMGHFVIIDIPEIKLILHWDKGTRVYIKLGAAWKNKVEGLCGNFNDDQLDDFQTPSGGIPEVSPMAFGDSWRLQHLCPKSFEITDTCTLRPDRKLWAMKQCGILKTSVFAPCHSEEPVEPYLERCIFDTCACDQGGDCNCLCTALAAYAHECDVKGISVKWRTPDLCPMQCDERCSNYEACLSPCPHETCDNMMVFGKLMSMCKQDVCIEGCQVKPCPEGEVFTNSSLLECVPKSNCNPVCLQIGNIAYLEGDLIEQDECHTCYCSRGNKVCQGQPCTTLPPTTKQILTTSMPQIQEMKCTPGWTAWINENRENGPKESDFEPLPNTIIMSQLGETRCHKDMMVDIECRTSDSHLSAKETNLNVECSLEKGLVCTSSGDTDECPDFEIRVKCQCQEKVIEACEVNQPYQPHAYDCYLYYRCEKTEFGNELVVRTCGPSLMFNPKKRKCDFPKKVYTVRPECQVTTTAPITEACSLESPNQGDSTDCYIYYRCEKTDRGNEIVAKTCYPDFMFNIKTLQCDFASNVNEVRSECREQPTVTEACNIIEPNKPHSSDCYLYYSCESKETGAELVGKTCGPNLMFNPVKAKCDFPMNVGLVRPECQPTLTTTETVITAICDLEEPNRPHPYDCHLYYKCEKTDIGNNLVEKSCGSMLMFNPLILKCDFPKKVTEVRPECKFATTIQPVTISEECDVNEPNKPEPNDCYTYYRCEKKDDGTQIVEKTCKPEFMFNPNTLQCDFPEKVVLTNPECEVITQPPVTEVCNTNEMDKPHPSDCYLYYHCEQKKTGAEFVGKTCGPELMFNPINQHCDFPANVVKVRPECRTTTIAPIPTPVCSVEEPSKPSQSDCYKYYRCEKTSLGIDWVTKTCYPELMFNPETKQCDLVKNVQAIQPQCEEKVAPVCKIDQPKNEHPTDCYLYYICKEGQLENTLSEETCGPSMMFNPTKKTCDLPENVVQVRPECQVIPVTTEVPTCEIDEPKRPNSNDCSTYYQCELTENGFELVEKNCSRMLMFNPVSLQCDFPKKVIQFKPECQVTTPEGVTTPGLTTPTRFPACDVTAQNIEVPDDCYLYHKCEVKENGPELVVKTCSPEFMFNPVTLECDFKEQVGVLKPICEEKPPVTEPCDITESNKPHTSDCYLYYRCEQKENRYELVGRTCGPMLMFNPVKLKCDFPANVAQVRPECEALTLKPVTEECQMDEPYRPKTGECYSYYHCKETDQGNELVESTCGPSKMFNPMTLSCDDPDNVADVKPECKILTKPPKTEACDVMESNRPSPYDCYNYFKCEERDGDIRVIEKSCKPDFMFNPVTLQCDFAESVIQIKPDCEKVVSTTEAAITQACSITDQKKPHVSDCYLYYQCEETETGNEIVGRTCGPMLMYNPVKLKCDFPKNVVEVRPECSIQTTKPPTEIPTEKPVTVCDVDEPKRLHPNDCYLYYRCEETTTGNDLVERTCGPTLMFNPVSLKCDFPKNVIKVKPECSLSTLAIPETESPATTPTATPKPTLTPACDVAGPSIADPNDCYLYYKCEENQNGVELIKKTCYPEFMFNPVTSQCEFPEQVEVIRPQCKTIAPVTEICDMTEPNKPHSSDCFLYYKCEQKENANELVGKTCGPTLMFNPIKLKCDFPFNVAEVRPECQPTTQKPVTKVCETDEPKRPNPNDCLSYFYCKETKEENNLETDTCGPFDMFNPLKLECDNADNVIKIMPECGIKPRVLEEDECKISEPNHPNPNDCYTYYKCEEKDYVALLVKKSCKPDFMFNPILSKCDFPQKVIEIKPECKEEVPTTQSSVSECDITDSKKPHPSDCYLYYQCEESEKGNDLVGRTCGPMLMFNSVKLKCDFPVNVAEVRPECAIPTQPPTEKSTEGVTEKPIKCEIDEPKRPNPRDCFLYYECEENEGGNDLVVRTCGSNLMFNPVSLKCDFSEKVIQFKPECGLSTPALPPIEMTTTTPVITSEPTLPPICDASGPSIEDPEDCYQYYRCEEIENNFELVKKTCYPEFMFNPVTLQCDFPEQVTVLRPECEKEVAVTEVCDVTESNRPHPSDCHLYYRCEKTVSGNKLEGKTCGSMLMFNPVKLACDFPANVAEDRPECKVTTPKPVTEVCTMDEPNRAKSNDCYSYYHCKESEKGNELVENSCGPQMMFNPMTLKCDDASNVGNIKPECKIVTTETPVTEECAVIEPNRPDSFDCYTYYKCEERNGIARLVEKSCKPDFMFNSVTLKCDFAENVVIVKPECQEQVTVTETEVPVTKVCDMTEPKKPHSSDCYLYYQCEESATGTDLVGKTCGPSLMFNPVKLRCDFSDNVAKTRPDCQIPTEVPKELQTETPKPICEIAEPPRSHPSDCFVYYKCKETESGFELVKRTCPPTLMFNPVALKCDVAKKVVQFRPECQMTTLSTFRTEAPTTTAMPICDIVGPSISDPKDCYLYYKCEKRNNTVELVKKTCYPEFMFNSITSQCDFPEQVGVLRPECANKPLPTEACDVAEPNKPHPSDCHLYYRCEDTITGNKLVGKTCGSMLMFNPVQLTCDFPVNVAKVRPECQATTLKPVTEVCEVDEPNRPKLNDCYSYYQCQKTESGNDLVEKTCGPRNMFNPVTLQCDESENVVNVKPECEVISQLPPSEECAISEPNRPMPNDCYTYYRCEEKDNIPQLVEKSCKPDFMFNPVTLKCDFPETVELLMPECKKEVPTTQPSIEKVCSTTDEKKPHVSDCYLYYQCEETEHQNEVIGKTCGPMLMFNPVKLKCDFPENVAKVRSECAMQTSKPPTEAPIEVLTTAPTEICDVTEPKRSHPSDCFLYYNCEESDGKPGLVESTCGPMLMFNPVSLKCDFPKNVVKVKPECSSSTPAPLETKSPSTTPAATLKTTPTPKCDVAGMSVADPDDCYLYYKCEEKENEVQLVKKTCYPEFMFNTVTLQCDFPESVSVIRPECKKKPPVAEPCDMAETSKPHPSDCYLYYLCEQTVKGNELIGRTCGPMLMFNPIKLKCDFPANVVKVKPECQPTTEQPVTEVCEMGEPNRPKPDDCYGYYQCQKSKEGNDLIEKTCGSEEMFNPITLKCANPLDVIEIKPECEKNVTMPELARECSLSEPVRPDTNDCYQYYKCIETKEGNQFVLKTCKPQFMFNPETSQCDFPENVIKVKSECEEQVLATLKPQVCETFEAKHPHPSDCYLYYECEETPNGNEVVGRTCGPMLMFNPIKLVCDFPVNVAQIRAECKAVTTPSTPTTVSTTLPVPVCDINEPKRPHPSDCFLYTNCEETDTGNALVEQTCGPTLMFNPITLKCDFPAKVVQFKPECEIKVSTTALPTPECDVIEPNKPHPTDCYLYYDCEERPEGIKLITKSCYPDFMFNPISGKCDFTEQVTILRPECQKVVITTEICAVNEPTKPHPSDCYLYYRCEDKENGAELVGKTCGPMLMFNPVKLKCDFPDNVIKIKPECQIQPTQPPTKLPKEACSMTEPTKAHETDCYLYYKCQETSHGNDLVEQTCGTMLMFNPLTLKCDFPTTVIKVQPDCTLQTPSPEGTPAPITPKPTTKVCDVSEPNLLEPSDCYLYYKCEEKENDIKLSTKTCYPEFMFNPVTLQCDFPDKVSLLRPECAEVSIATEACDINEPSKSHLSDCYLYYKCVEMKNGAELVGNTCGPDLMFNPIKLKCDFPANVVLVRPECHVATVKPVTEVCEMSDQKLPNTKDCFTYYQCQETDNGNDLVTKTCGPMLMFNSVTLKCDFPEKVAQFRPECEMTTPSVTAITGVTQVCSIDEPSKSDPTDCYTFFICQKNENHNDIVKKTCYPEFMFNPVTLKCDFRENVVPLRPECQEITTIPTIETCDMSEPNHPHPNDCHLYYKCKKSETGETLVGETCGTNSMFNPIKLNCDEPENVIKIKPECQEATTAPPVTKVCDVTEPKRSSLVDCYKYYQCEMTETGEDIIEKTCGPLLMFNPLILKCDFPKNVEKVKPECSATTEKPVTQICNVDQPKIEAPNDCYVYYDCEEREFQTQLVKKTCYPEFMFNPVNLTCDFPENVELIKPICKETTEAPITEMCDINEPNKPHPSDCYLYYKCEITENVAQLVGKTCGPDLMFNPVKLQCDFPAKVSEIRSDCALLTTQTPQTETPTTLVCNLNEPSRPYPDDCYKYYQCQATDRGFQLVLATCEPMLMFNPIKLKCDFPKNVIPVKPECELTTVPETTISTTAICNVNEPYRPHPVNCYKYYECTASISGATLEEKSCGPVMMFNPKTNECDFAKKVTLVRPECKEQEKICDDDEHYDECAIDCTRLCQSYQQTLLDKQMCIDNKCEPGCVPNLFNCGPDMFWKDERTCVPKKDCMCTTNDGYPVKPGVVTSETECRRCQCVDNFYTCDESACTTTTLKPITKPVVELTTAISYEKTTISIVTPPPECIEENLIDLIDGELPLPDKALTASSEKNINYSAPNARFSVKFEDISAGVWAPEENDKEPFLQIHFERQELIYGIKIKGNPISNQFVRSYAVSYSPDNGKTYHYIRDINKQLYYFKGCIDSRTVSTQYLPAPIEATDIKIHPVTNNNGVAMKVELIGCKKITTPTATTATVLPQPLCKDPMGVENGLLSLDQISVSSELNAEHNKEYLKINGKSAWQTITNNPTEWVQFDFLEPRKLTGITTQGGNVGWVTAYIVKYSPDGKNWNPIIDKNGNEKTFYGNVDQNTIETNYFDETIQATYIRVYPVSWHENIQMRIEPKGCFVSYPKVSTTVQPTTVIHTTQTPSAQTSKICNVCPDITLPNDECLCNDKAWWDGDKCVERSYCPCIDKHITYPVGGAFENAECEECVCKLGGVVHCTKKTCNPCAHGLKSVLTSTCNCVCEPCKVGTVLCPTSNICIDEDSWCNGVKDCPDDETGCVTTPELIETTSVVPKKECIIPKCIETYEPVKMSNSDSTPWNRKTAFTTKSANSGVKTGAKITKNPVSSKTPGVTQERKQVIKNQISLTECPLYECKPKYPNEKVCPKIECPLGEHYVLIESNNNCQEYICELDQPEDAVCELSGSTFETFDGVVYEYDIFDHILARDMIYGAWIITLQEECIEICTSRIIIEHDEDVFVLYSDLSIKFNTRRYSIFEIKKLMYKANTIDFDITHLGHQVLFISNKYGFWVIWDEQENGKIGMTQKLSGQVDGLCGYFDKNPGDDKMKPDGEVGKTTEEFVNSWKTPNSNLTQVVTTCNANVRNEAVDLCNSIDEEAFESCKSSVNVDKFKSQCVHSTCNCLNAANGDPMEKEQCRCLLMQNFVVECLSEDSTVELFDWRTLYNCPTTCEEPLVHYDCYQRRCEPTCGNLADYSACPKIDNICFPGCYCPKGYVRRGKECVLPIDCEDCVCHLLPHLKYVTYDKETYTIDGDCEYVITQDQTNENGEQAFNILAKTIPCTNDKNLACVDSIRILYNNHELKITRDTNENKIALLLDSTQLKNYDDIEKWVNIEMNPDENLEISLSEIQVKIQIYYPKLAATFSLPSIKYGGKLEGLCGNCNENPKDDYITSNKTIPKTIDEFGESWVYNKVKECKNKPLKECTLSEEESSICNHLLSEPFHECNEDLDPSIFIEWCKEDICNNEQPIACEAFEAYAKECNYLGYCVEWRSSICPAKCAPSLEFKSCPSVCSLTCETYNSNDCSETALEGCVCPEGQVLFNSTTCVPKNKCIPCDEEEHYSGDTWIVDKCTKCSCNGQSKTCETKTCPSVDSLCQDGYKVEMIPLKDECCDKYVCVPITGTEVPCEAPQPITCSENQIMTIVKKSDGCMQYACECIPVDECEKIDLDNIPSSETGVTHEIDNNGCCPIAVEKCQKELCPTKPTCPEFHTISVKNGTCCEFYTCDPLKDKCIVALKYEDDENGGEKEVKQRIVVKEVNETWKDGPCRTCQCQSLVTDTLVDTCTLETCPNKPEETDYVYKPIFIKGTCCPMFEKVSCVMDDIIHKVGETWTKEEDYCTRYKCDQVLGGVEKIISVNHCEETCELGWSYTQPAIDSKQCCGECKPTGCVVNNTIYVIGEKWKSSDNCINYHCSNDNGQVHVETDKITCPEIDKEIWENYVIEQEFKEGNCCMDLELTACKANGKTYQVGESWPAPDGDKCKSIVCTKNSLDEITKQEAIETCNSECAKGWEYKKSDYECCGECVQVACVINGNLKFLGEQWKSEDGCTTFSCEMNEGQLRLVSQQQSCPDVSKCPSQYLVESECCSHCNLPISTCAVVSLNATNTIGKISIEELGHGICINKNPIVDLAECNGVCESLASFDFSHMNYNSKCTCCQVEEVKDITVELECEDGNVIKRQIPVAVNCKCKECAGL